MVVWAEKDSNLRSRKTADLQSAPVGRLGICPVFFGKGIVTCLSEKKSRLPESNQRPTDYKSVALPAELKRPIFILKNYPRLKGDCKSR